MRMDDKDCSIELSNQELATLCEEAERCEQTPGKLMECAIRQMLTEGQKPSLTPEDLGAWAQMRKAKLKRPVNLDLALVETSEPSEVVLACYLGHILHLYSDQLWKTIFSKASPREIARFGLLATMASDVAKYTYRRDCCPPKITHDEDFPLSFCLPGYASDQVFESAGSVLLHFSFPLYDHREIIEQKILSGLDIIGQIELCEALVIAQAVVDRAGGDPETEACERENTTTRLAQLSWKYKAEFYSAKFDPEQERADAQKVLQKPRAEFEAVIKSFADRHGTTSEKVIRDWFVDGIVDPELVKAQDAIFKPYARQLAAVRRS